MKLQKINFIIRQRKIKKWNKKDEKELTDWKWPFLRVNFGGGTEYYCPHGQGHGGTHGCDGCCGHESYERANGKRKLIKRLLSEKRKAKKNKRKTC